MRSIRSVAAMLLLVGALAACTSAEVDESRATDESTDAGADDAEPADGPTLVQPGAPGEPSQALDPDDLPDTVDPPHTDADVAFMQGMMLHHVQALRMTRLVPERSASEDIPRFAERMDISQEDEIELMRNWLEARDEEVPALSTHDHDGSAGDGDHELMPGMLTESELRELEEADGEDFDRLFLEGMIRHHEGALTMVEALFEEGGGMGTEIFQFANHVQSDQQIELNRMREMLADMDGTS